MLRQIQLFEIVIVYLVYRNVKIADLNPCALPNFPVLQESRFEEVDLDGDMRNSFYQKLSFFHERDLDVVVYLEMLHIFFSDEEFISF